MFDVRCSKLNVRSAVAPLELWRTGCSMFGLVQSWFKVVTFFRLPPLLRPLLFVHGLHGLWGLFPLPHSLFRQDHYSQDYLPHVVPVFFDLISFCLIFFFFNRPACNRPASILLPLIVLSLGYLYVTTYIRTGPLSLNVESWALNVGRSVFICVFFFNVNLFRHSSFIFIHSYIDDIQPNAHD